MANYRETLNLPKTDFDMRANLVKKEPLQLEKWYAEDLYAKILEHNKDKPLFVLHDGPPYANGDIHVGTAFNKILKDIIVKYKSMSGHLAPYVPGWDCHGQPIEHEVEKQLGPKKAGMSQAVFRRLCREYAFKFLDRQREQFKRLGVLGDWDDPYLTLNHEYEAANIEIFKAMYLRGVIYHGTKPIHWCKKCKTALAEAEIEYKDETSPSVYVKFKAVEGAETVLKKAGLYAAVAGKELKVLIWTTTPWTLPANVAVALNPDAEYSFLDNGSELLIVAKELVASLQEETDLAGYAEAAMLRGSELDGLILTHPIFEDKISRVVFADYVSLATGSGAVHIAPGHGQEDYLVGQKYKLPSPMPVDGDGKFTDEAGWLSGIDIYEGNEKIIAFLTEQETLLARSDISHSYPHCWRCKSPVIFRATSQWFISMEEDGLRDEALKAVREVSWVPDWSIRRIEAMVSDRPDWCISRQRSWGVPIPIFYCEKCGQILGTEASFDAVIGLFNEEGADSWFIKDASEILPAGTVCASPGCGGAQFRKETDILDVWFESGVSHAAVLKKRPDLRWPADLYLEGSDQHRGWFQSSLFCSVGAYHAAPFKQVLTHGFVVDGDGRKMSKSLGNVIDPLDVIANSGADILRLWVASQDYSVDVAISKDILDYISDAYRRIRNTIRFLHGNLADFDWVEDKVRTEDLLEIDKWALVRLNRLIKEATQAYEGHSYHQVFHKVYNFCVIDMSSFYLDILKDRMYTAPPGSLERTSGQTVISEIILNLTKLVAPVLSFTTEEIWAIIPDNVSRASSIHMEAMPEADDSLLSAGIEERWGELLNVRGEVLKALEIARQEKVIGNSVEAAVHLYVTDTLAGMLNEFGDDLLSSIFIVSHTEISVGEGPEDAYHSQAISGFSVAADKARGEKCERCWNFRSSVGKHPEYATLCSRCIRALESIKS